MFMNNWAILGFDKPIVYFKYNIGVWDVIIGLRICFLVCGVWLSMGIIQHPNYNPY